MSEATVIKPGQVSARGLVNLFIVYLVWGGTYLAIRAAVRPGAGFPPFTLGMTRTMLAGTVLLLWGILRNGLPKVSKADLLVFATSGILIWTASNGMIVWAEQRVESSLAAVLGATVPLWTVAIESVIQRQWPNARVWAALMIGFTGTVVLSIPELGSGDTNDSLSMLLLVLAPITFSLGILVQRHHVTAVPARVSSGFQMLFAAPGYAILVFLAGEGMPQPTSTALIAWAYLTIFGSIIAFTAFVAMVRALPAGLAMTYAYVNPVIAVILGAWLLSERVTIYTLIGTALILLGVVVVFRESIDRH